MTRKKDIKIEIDNYVKGNYSKNIAIELLKRDGFSESEINEHVHKLDIAEKVNSMNFMFVPGFLFNLLTSFFLLGSAFGFSSDENNYTSISLLGFILSIPLIYFYCKGEKLSVLITGLAIICVMLFLIIRIFSANTSLVSSLFSILFLALILNSVKNYYKSS